MKKYFEIIHITRNNFIELVNGLSIDQLNKIPDGFHNNIAWNFGHIVVTTQGLCYRLSGLPLNIDSSIIDRYKKGTKPQSFIPQTEIDFLKPSRIAILINCKLIMLTAFSNLSQAIRPALIQR
ncbi:DinB family protein [Niabella ginsengisoli]|uniref:DinB family protein n=1 Tax=Niabella ginsengisoli TaxID=522298 RepID=A0ABS9SJV0_9BACT|nr:DinB family protein [Niabella ginsengisoli]MCH5598459.1 DinB family protein [Niabella ginsengisoli]